MLKYTQFKGPLLLFLIVEYVGIYLIGMQVKHLLEARSTLMSMRYQNENKTLPDLDSLRRAIHECNAGSHLIVFGPIKSLDPKIFQSPIKDCNVQIGLFITSVVLSLLVLPAIFYTILKNNICSTCLYLWIDALANVFTIVNVALYWSNEGTRIASVVSIVGASTVSCTLELLMKRLKKDSGEVHESELCCY
jgi:hypothetical protein